MGYETLDVGTQTQFFLDELFVKRAEGVRLQVEPARKAGVALAPEKPWEEYRLRS